jgi:hypothetical protein
MQNVSETSQNLEPVTKTSHTDAVSIISHGDQFKQGKRNQQVFVLLFVFLFSIHEMGTELNVCLYVCQFVARATFV